MPANNPTGRHSVPPFTSRSCGKCPELDTVEMVACDKCEKWFHFACVGVTDDVSEKDWICEVCAAKEKPPENEQQASTSKEARPTGAIPKQMSQHDPGSTQHLDVSQNRKSQSKTSSKLSKVSSRRKRELELEHLRAEEELNAKITAEMERRIAEDTAKQIKIQTEAAKVIQLIHESESRQREHLAKQKAIFEAKMLERRFELRRQQEESDDSNHSDITDFSKPDVDKWLANSKRHFKSRAEEGNEPGATVRATAVTQPNLPNPFAPQPTLRNARADYMPVSYPPNQPSFVAAPQHNQGAQTGYPEQPNYIPTYWPRPEQNAPPQQHREQPREQSNGYEYNRLNSRQIATRQVLSKDLPSFSGRPEEWAMFIANFEQSTQICGYSNHENMLRLQRALKGKALKAVETRLLIPNNVQTVIETLRMLFGDPEIIVDSMLQNIRAYPAIKADKIDGLMDFALHVDGLCSTIESTGLVEELRNSTLLRELVAKLPMPIKLNWGMYVESSQPFPPPMHGAVRPTLTVFSNWLSHVARSARRVTLSATNQCPMSTSETRREIKAKQVNAHAVESNERTDRVSSNKQKQSCVTCKSMTHKIDSCSKFKDLTLNEKWQTVNDNHLCRKCLGHHNAYRCSSHKLCGVNDCSFKHHPLLHNVNRQTNTDSNRESVVATHATSEPCNTHHANKNALLFRIVPVTLYGNGKHVQTFAFLDDGSSISLVEQTLADELGIRGTPESLCLRWTADQLRTENDSQRIVLQISAQQPDAKRYTIADVRTVKELSLPRQSVLQSTIEQHQYLHNIPIQTYSDASPRILIGLDHWKLGMPQLVREGSWSQPVATKTRLGWVLQGRYKEDLQQLADFSLHMCECLGKDDKLHQQVKQFFSIESFGVAVPSTGIESKEDSRARRLLETTTARDDRGFTTGLLWKYDDIHLPDSLPMAKRRMICLEKKMQRDVELAANLQNQIREYKTKGYIRALSEEEVREPHNRVWYLPIFAVTNPNKPGKVRMVWDAAAKVNGISLNSVLLKGPDELASLPGVLQRFRQKPIAICGDIQEMYHQVRVNADDQHSQRFLWRDGESSEPVYFAMQVMTFGATCSPSSAQYIKNRNAAEFKDEFPRAYTSIVENHYVDDMLDSVDTEEDAINLAASVAYVHQKGGFHIRNWVSNSKHVLRKLGATTQHQTKNLQMSSDEAPAKVLGMWWCTDSDHFTFSLSLNRTSSEIIGGTQRPTKRELLRTLMSIYDPLGFLAFFLIPVKILLQEVWRSGIDWDDQLNDHQFERWLNWVTLLPLVETIRIPRCYFTQLMSQESTVQLHVFVDAGEFAYASVAYFRLCSPTGDTECAIVGAKTRVAPVQPLSIPRMELQAAVLGTRLSLSIAKNHNLQISKTVFWSDSRNVLSWIKSDARRFKQFVAFRIGEILESSNPDQWRGISTKDNVADEATKIQKNYDFETTSRWQNGPNFLKFSEERWPTDTSERQESDEIELRPCFVHTWTTQTVGFDSERFSNWKRLLRAQAYVNRFVFNLKAKKNKTPTIYSAYFSQDEYKRAEVMLFRQAQLEGFSDELAILHRNKNRPEIEQQYLDKTSEIYKLSPYLDEDNLIRMKGRIDAIDNVNFDSKRPVILPRKNHISYLIVDDFHRRFHHQNQETVVNEIRQRFWISSIRQMVKANRNRCQRCKNARATPMMPEMAPLPPARLAAYCRPFSCTGVDLFGPLSITVGRHSEKRWGVLFTCLTIRAVHIEVAHSLSTDSFILCLKNFMARRGTPNEIYSDNGTNFVGTEHELKTEAAKINFGEITAFTEAKIRWFFNPPASPHMGGAWERLVRSTKKTLYAIMPARKPNEETLQSLLIEVENIINARPLTHIPVESTEPEALTPNHFLLGSSNGTKPLGIFDDDVLMMRKNWKKAERLAATFWKKWIVEYLPTITRRSKWFHRTKPIEIGDVVIVVDQNNAKNSWPKGIVLDVVRGKDGQVRHANIQTASGIYKRPAVKLAVLDLSSGK